MDIGQQYFLYDKSILVDNKHSLHSYAEQYRKQMGNKQQYFPYVESAHKDNNPFSSRKLNSMKSRWMIDNNTFSVFNQPGETINTFSTHMLNNIES